MMNFIESFFMIGILTGYFIFSAFIDDKNPQASEWTKVYFLLAGLAILAFLLLLSTPIKENEISGSTKPNLLITVRDGSGLINLRFFHFMAAQKEHLAIGTRVRCFGEVRHGFRSLEMFHPEYRRILSDEMIMPADATLTPIYPSTEGLNQKTLQTS